MAWVGVESWESRKLPGRLELVARSEDKRLEGEGTRRRLELGRGAGGVVSELGGGPDLVDFAAQSSCFLLLIQGGARRASVMREQLVSFTAATEEQKDLEASPRGELQMNGLHAGCIRLQEAEDPVRPKDKRQEVKEEWGKEQNDGRRGK